MSAHQKIAKLLGRCHGDHHEHMRSTIAIFSAQEERIAKLETMLVQLQWCGDEEPCGPSICPWCGAVESYGLGHEDDCELAALLPKEATDEVNP